MLALLLIVWNQERQQALHFRHEFLRHGVIQHEVAHIRIQPGMPPQPRNVERVRQKAHIKHKIRLHGQPALIAEGVHLNVHGVRLTVAVENHFELLAQLPRLQNGGVNDVIRRLAQGLHDSAFLANRLNQRHVLPRQRMVTARLLIAADEHVIRRFKVERFDLIADLPALGNQVADRFCIEELAAAHVHRHRNEGAMERRFLDGFHHAEHHIRRQIIHAECAHIFQIAVDGRFARAA